jgi:hypothetical protein
LKKGKEMNASEISGIIPEIFGLIIRVTGLAIAVSGVINIFQGLIMMMGDISIRSFLELFFGVPALVIGIWFLRGAPWLLSFSYPQDKIK